MIHEGLALAVMSFVFLGVGIILPVVVMFRKQARQAKLANKLILWITMVFCMIMIFGAVVDFVWVTESVREIVMEYSFITVLAFGLVFGVDDLIKSRVVKTIQWKDLTVTASDGKSTLGDSDMGDSLIEPQTIETDETMEKVLYNDNENEVRNESNNVGGGANFSNSDAPIRKSK